MTEKHFRGDTHVTPYASAASVSTHSKDHRGCGQYIRPAAATRVIAVLTGIELAVADRTLIMQVTAAHLQAGGH